MNQPSALKGMFCTLTPLTKAVGVPNTPYARAYFH